MRTLCRNTPSVHRLVIAHRWPIALVGVAMLLVSTAGTAAQNAGADDNATAATTQPAVQVPPLASPRGTITSFLLAMQDDNINEAVACLDLSEIDEQKRETRGAELARMLRGLIEDRLPQIKPEVLPDEPDYADPDQPGGQQVFVLTRAKDAEGRDKPELVLVRGQDGLWRFSRETVTAVPSLYVPLTTRAATPAPTPVQDDVPVHLSSARATVETFMESMKAVGRDPERITDALGCMDLSGIEQTVRDELGRKRAKLLYSVLKNENIVYGMIPNDPVGKPYEQLAEGKIVIKRQNDGRWLFTAETVENALKLALAVQPQNGSEQDAEMTEVIGELSSKFWLERQVPASLRQEFLSVQYWHWIALMIIILVGLVADQLALVIVGALVDSFARHRRLTLDKKLRATSLRPLGLVAMGLLWWYGLDLLSLSFPHTAYAILSVSVKIIAGASGVWAVYRFIDLLGGYLAAAAAKTESRYDDLLVPLVRKTLKIAVTVVGFVFVAEVFSLPVKTLLTSLGIGGLAIGFAARETLQNFFGSITVLLDRPFHIGDWVVIGDVEGTVEAVGFRSTRIRTFYNSQITVPNGTLLTAKVDNMGARRYRRIKAMLSLTYDTPPEKMDAFCEGIRELIRQHPYTRKDYFHVYFNQFADSSLNVLLYCFHEAPDWGTELRERHRLFNDILRLAKRIGVSFAFPTQTLHLQQEPAAPPAASPMPGEPAAIGRKTARTIVRETGLPGSIPPPVSFDSLESRGESDDSDGGE